MRCKRSLSVGSLIQPSMGIALSTFNQSENYLGVLNNNFTFMKYVTQRAIIKYHDPAQVRFH